MGELPLSSEGRAEPAIACAAPHASANAPPSNRSMLTLINGTASDVLGVGGAASCVPVCPYVLKPTGIRVQSEKIASDWIHRLLLTQKYCHIPQNPPVPAGVRIVP